MRLDYSMFSAILNAILSKSLNEYLELAHSAVLIISCNWVKTLLMLKTTYILITHNKTLANWMENYQPELNV